MGRAFRRYGFEGATMSVLSRETGLGRSSLYHYFPTGKSGMALSALSRVEAFLRDGIGPLLLGGGPVMESGRAAVDAFLRYYEGGSLGCLVGAFSLQDCPPEVTERTRAVTESWIDQFEAFYRRRNADHPRRTASDAIAAIQGALVLSGLRNDNHLLRETLEKYLLTTER